MGTTNRSVNKQEGKVPDAVLEKAKAEERKSKFSLSAVLMALGMGFHKAGKGSKIYENLTVNKPGHKKNKRRAQNKARAVQARKNKTW